MKTISKTVEIYQTVDFKTFTDHEAAINHENKINEEILAKGLDLRQFVLLGETWGSFLIDNISKLGVYKVIEVSPLKIVVLDHNEKIQEVGFEFWHKPHSYQILDMIEKFRRS